METLSSRPGDCNRSPIEESWRKAIGQSRPNMNIIGADFLRLMLESDGHYFKLILSETGAFFFPYTTEHRDATQPGLCYKDDSLGNALAATITPRQIEIRLHRAFSDQHVTTIDQRLLKHPDMELLTGFVVNYQGRTLIQ